MDDLSTILGMLWKETPLVFICDGGKVDTITSIVGERLASIFTIEETTRALPDRKGDVLDGILDKYSSNLIGGHTFIIFCTISCISQFLYKMNTHEHKYVEQGVMTFLHQSFLVVGNDTWLDIIENQVQNITNLSAFSMQPGSKHTSAAMWKPEGRKWEKSARVVNRMIEGDIFPNVKYGLNGRKFSVTTNVWWPYVFHQGKNTTREAQYTGICVELLKVLAQEMNFTYELSESPSRQWGSQINGIWNGMVRLLMDKETDLLATTLNIDPLRHTVMDFAFPFLYESAAIVYQKYKHGDGHYSFVTKPFKPEVWLCIMIMVPLVGVAMHLLSLGYLQWIHPHREHTGKDRSLSNRVWEAYGSLLAQGMMDRKEDHLPHLVFFFLAATVVMLAAVYKGNLAAMSMVRKNHHPFNSLVDLGRQNVYKYGTVGGASDANSMQAVDIYSDIWQRMVAWNESGIPVLADNISVHMKMISEGGYAMLTASSVIHKLPSNAPERIDMLLIQDLPKKYAFGFQKNSAYTDKASKLIMRLIQSGIISEWENVYNKGRRKSNTRVSVSTPSVSASDLSAVFTLLLLLLLTGCLILIVEICIHKRRRPQNDE